MMNTTSGIISSAPVMYVSHLNGLTPKTLNAHTSDDRGDRDHVRRPKWTLPMSKYGFELGNQR